MADNSISIPYNFTPRPYQLRFFQRMDNGCKRYFKRWSRRAGKDICDFNFMIKKAFERVGNYYYIFPNYTQGKKAIWEGKTKGEQRYIDFIPPGWGRFNSNEMRIELANKSIIRVVGSEDIHALRGAGACGIVISEFAWQSMEVIEVLEPMLMENGGWLIINSTPRGKNHMYEFENTIASNPAWFVDEIQSLWPDLPNYYPVITSRDLDTAYNEGKLTFDEYMTLAQQETTVGIEAVRARGADEEYIEQEYGVSYVAGQKGAYYADCITKARKEGRIGKWCFSDHKYVDTFWDLGITDDTAVWFRQIDGNRIIWGDYYENNTKDLAHYVQMLKEKGYNYRTIYLPHDGKSKVLQTGMSTKDLLIRLLQEAGIQAEIIIADKPMSRHIPINLVRERFSRYHFNEETCNDGVKKLSLFHRQWDKNTQSFRDYPAHDWTSHAADAIAIEGITGNINETFISGKDLEIITDFDPLNYRGTDDI